LAIMLAVFHVLIHSFTGQSYIVTTVSASHRCLPGGRFLVGPLTAPLVLRVDVSDDPGFKELLGRVLNVLMMTHCKQDMLLEGLVDAPQIDAGADDTSGLRYMLTFDSDFPSMPLPGLKTETMDIVGRPAMYDLALRLVNRDQEIVGFAEYNGDVFSAEHIVLMLDEFSNYLRLALTHPEAQIKQLISYLKEETSGHDAEPSFQFEPRMGSMD
jgi:non-ribosomal peptide synthetase component F